MTSPMVIQSVSECGLGPRSPFWGTVGQLLRRSVMWIETNGLPLLICQVTNALLKKEITAHSGRDTDLASEGETGP